MAVNLSFVAGRILVCLDASSDLVLEIASRNSDRNIDISGILDLDGTLRGTQCIYPDVWNVYVGIAMLLRRRERVRTMQQWSGVDA